MTSHAEAALPASNVPVRTGKTRLVIAANAVPMRGGRGFNLRHMAEGLCESIPVPNRSAGTTSNEPGQWRIIDPPVGMPFLLLQVFFVSAAVERPQSGSVPLAAGISTALLFYVWFYYWSAAVAALAIGFVLDRSARRAYATILGIGLGAGAPAIIEGLITKPLLDPQALHRIGFFAPVPRLAFFLLPKAGLIALFVTGAWIWRKLTRDGLWCLALAALALSNNHIISGLDLRAGHWRIMWGTGLSILVFVMAAQVCITTFDYRVRP
jgi:hypothetical protein